MSDRLSTRIMMAANVAEEVNVRRRSALIVLSVVFAITILLVLLALTGFRINLPAMISAPTMGGFFRIAILICGFGAVAIRRTRLSPARLTDIAALKGVSALLETLRNTTMMLGVLGGSIAVLGFLLTMITSNTLDVLCGAGIALAVLLYAYPRRVAWLAVLKAVDNSSGL